MKYGIIVFTLLQVLSACSPLPIAGSTEVVEAYQVSGAVTVKPYTRTIFSTHDF
jgi:hypothetical protein